MAASKVMTSGESLFVPSTLSWTPTPACVSLLKGPSGSNGEDTWPCGKFEPEKTMRNATMFARSPSLRTGWKGGSLTVQEMDMLFQRRYFIHEFLSNLYQEGKYRAESEGETPIPPRVPTFFLNPNAKAISRGELPSLANFLTESNNC